MANLLDELIPKRHVSVALPGNGGVLQVEYKGYNAGVVALQLTHRGTTVVASVQGNAMRRSTWPAFARWADAWFVEAEEGGASE